MDTQPIHDDIGRTIGGKYRLVRLIGRGGMGAVYEAENTWTHRRVALKLLRPEYARDTDAVRRFMREAQSASRIAHPNIVDVLDLGQEGEAGSLYMVQELLVGEDLRRRLRARKRLDPAAALDVVVPIVAALAAAHARGIVHRDLKPENVFLCRTPAGDELPKLIDFGIAKTFAAEARAGQDGVPRVDDGVQATAAGMVMGTPRYMAPEQLEGRARVDARCDVWAIGVVLHEVLTGENPFEASSPFLAINRVLTETPAALSACVPGVELALSALCQRALARAPEQRFAHAGELLQALLAAPALAPGIDGAEVARRHRQSVAAVAAVAASAQRPEPAAMADLPPPQAAGGMAPVALPGAARASGPGRGLEATLPLPSPAATPSQSLWMEPSLPVPAPGSAASGSGPAAAAPAQPDPADSSPMPPGGTEPVAIGEIQSAAAPAVPRPAGRGRPLVAAAVAVVLVAGVAGAIRFLPSSSSPARTPAGDAMTAPPPAPPMVPAPTEPSPPQAALDAATHADGVGAISADAGAPALDAAAVAEPAAVEPAAVPGPTRRPSRSLPKRHRARPVARPAAGPAVRPAPPSEGANQAPILE
jgi:serine/threonine-protein kinase